MNTIQMLHAYVKAGGDTEKIATFTGVKSKTVAVWLKGDWAPSGLPLLHLRNFLRMEGYVPRELSEIDPICDKIGQLLSHKFISYGEMLKHFNLDDTGHGHHFLSRQLLRASRISSPERLSQAQNLVDRYADSLRQICDGYKKPVTQTSNTVTDMTAGRKPVAMSSAPARTAGLDDIGKVFVMKSLKALVVATAPIAALVASDRFSPDERKGLRDGFSNKELHHLVDDLQKLLSEATRRQLQERDQS